MCHPACTYLWESVCPVGVPEVVDLEPDDGPGDLADDVVEEGGQHPEGAQQGRGAPALVLHLQTYGLYKESAWVERIFLAKASQTYLRNSQKLTKNSYKYTT